MDSNFTMVHSKQHLLSFYIVKKEKHILQLNQKITASGGSQWFRKNKQKSHLHSVGQVETRTGFPFE